MQDKRIMMAHLNAWTQEATYICIAYQACWTSKKSLRLIAMTKLDSFVERFLVVACGNVEEAGNRLDINRLGEDDMDDDSFLTYLADDDTIRTYLDDATVNTDATTRYTDSGFETQRPDEQVMRAIDTIKKHADRLGVSAEEILRSPILLQRIREQQRNVSRDAERKWLDVLCAVACDQSTFQCPSMMREGQDDFGYIGDSFSVAENDDFSYASASVSELTTDSEHLFANQRTSRAGNSNRRFKKQYSTRNVLQTINETHSDGKGDSDTKRRLVRLW